MGADAGAVVVSMTIVRSSGPQNNSECWHSFQSPPQQALHAKTRPGRGSLQPFGRSCVCVIGPRLFRLRPKIITSWSTTTAWFGTAFAETDLDRADLETTIADLMSGQHCDPLRVIRFNPETDRAEDVSAMEEIGEISRERSSAMEGWIDGHEASIDATE